VETRRDVLATDIARLTEQESELRPQAAKYAELRKLSAAFKPRLGAAEAALDLVRQRYGGSGFAVIRHIGTDE
jgi:hypothetical protein